MKPKPTKPIEIKATIVRSEAIVTIVISEVTHTLTETEAKKLYEQLKTILNIQPDIRYMRQDPAVLPPFRFPTTYPQSPSPKRPGEYEVTC